ncbi:unnamed protein product [marine sediment metagenome]|uniref:PhoU domain-containing protein n=1 Tax=marine sediment metagenome TaxID=412755 RepID=X1T2I4_9ZZZZ
MRTKAQILQESSKAVVEAPKEAQQMIAHEYLMLEVFIDIRDTIHKACKDIQEAIWNMPDKD